MRANATYMRLFFEAWSPCAEIQHLASVGFGGVAFQHLASVESHYLTSNEFGSTQNRQLPTAEIRPMPLGDLDKDDIAAFFSIGFTMIHHQLGISALERQTFVETFKYKLIYVYAIDDKKHEGYLKVGDTDVVSSLAPDQLAPNCKALNDAARARIDQQTQICICSKFRSDENAMAESRFKSGEYTHGGNCDSYSHIYRR